MMISMDEIVSPIIINLSMVTRISIVTKISMVARISILTKISMVARI